MKPINLKAIAFATALLSSVSAIAGSGVNSVLFTPMRGTVSQSQNTTAFTPDFTSADRNYSWARPYFSGLINEPEENASAADKLGLDLTETSSVPNSFFGTVAIPFSNNSAKGEWSRVRSQQALKSDKCKSAACRSRESKIVSASANNSRSFYEKLDGVNRTVNALIKYDSDRSIYGTMDHWAAASRTIAGGRGDCEDFAILKYTMLVNAGVPAKSLSLVVLKDKSRNLYHAVLAVSTNKGHFILDNVVNRVYRDREMPQYQPLFSFSTNRSWIHGVPGEATDKVASQTVKLGSIAPGEATGSTPDLAVLTDDFLADLRPAIHSE